MRHLILVALGILIVVAAVAVGAASGVLGSNARTTVARDNVWPPSGRIIFTRASIGLESTAAGSAASQLPNPCKLLAAAHPETAFNQGKPLTVSHRQSSHEFVGVPLAICAETVGSHSVELWLSTALRGVVPAAKVRSQKHLPGLGPGATLTVYSFHGWVSQAVTFHRDVAPAPAPIYESVSLPSATHPAALETLARRLYTEF